MMIMPSDHDFVLTKKIQLRQSTINEVSARMALRIHHLFGLKPINIIYQLPSNDQNATINVCFEYEHEQEAFLAPDGLHFDKDKQALIGQLFREAAGYYGETWVYFSAFAPVARAEANSQVSYEQIKKLKNELKVAELWEISTFSEAVTFFLYRDEQVKQFENRDERRLWANKYFDLLEPFDQFHYFSRQSFKINLDSKENFDKNFSSNWFYYYK